MSVLDQLDDWPVPNAAAAIVGPDGVRATYGDTTRMFRLASVTKPLSALAILVAVEEEAVTLDDAADEALLPGATLRHLLSHASGMAPERRMKAAPAGARRIYSNVGIELASSLVERATGMGFPSYLEEALEPLGLTGTSLPGSPAKDGVSTVDDLARVAHELLAPQGFLAASTLADLRTVQFPGLRGVVPGFGAQDPNDWGLGFELRAQKSPHWTGASNSPQTYGHFGQAGTMFWIDPAANLALVALTDRDFGPWAADAWPKLADDVLADS